MLLASVLLSGCNRSSENSATSAPTSAASSTASAISTAAATSTQATSPESSEPQPTERSADISWTAPTTNTNGSALTNLAGYRIYYGTSPNALNQTIDVPSAGATDHVVQGLAQGTWYFAVAAYTNVGLQSSFSTVVSKTIS